MRISAKVLFGGGRNKEETAKEQVKRYLGLARGLSEKIEWSMLAIYERGAINKPGRGVCSENRDDGVFSRDVE